VNGLSSAISGVGSAIGRYFSVVSFIPSLFLVAFTFALIESGAWHGNGEPNWAKAGDALTHVGNLVLLSLISIAIGIAIHPIQFALVQFLEGYWGTGSLAQRARVARMLHHRRRHDLLKDLAAPAAAQISEDDQAAEPLGTRARIELVSRRDESLRLLRGYPGRYSKSDDDIMPTRLGNVLRSYERLAGYQYGLDAVIVLRHVGLVAPPGHVDYLNDQRQLLDLSVRMCVTSVFGVVISIAFLWHHGPWLAIALVPYGLAYLSYRGAIVVAHEYGAAMSTIIDLDRFALYDSLKLPRPASTAQEQETNPELIRLLSHERSVDLRYEYRDAPTDANVEPTGAQPAIQWGTEDGGADGDQGDG
jgi:hypothetical protein